MKCDFPDSLRFSVPSNGGWNLAHICRLIPDSHVLFATPQGCSRIIMLSALEKGMAGRFSALSIKSGDLINGDVEKKIADAAASVIDALGKKGGAPKVFLIFTSCVDGFIGTDHDVYLNELKTKYPEIRFLDCRMDPINREDGVPPIVRMHKEICSLFEKARKDKAVNVIGSFLPPKRDGELAAYLKENGYTVRHAYSCKSYYGLKAMGNSALNLVVHDSALPAAKELYTRLSQPYVSLVTGDIFRDMPEKYGEVCSLLGLPAPDTDAMVRETSRVLDAEAKRLRGRSIVIDDGATSRPYSLARTLIEHGFNVKRLFCCGCPRTEADALAALSEDMEIISGDAPSLHSAYAEKRYFDSEAVAIGETAAYLSDTRHFITPLVFDGAFGYSYLADTARGLGAAADNERPLTDILETARGCAAL